MMFSYTKWISPAKWTGAFTLSMLMGFATQAATLESIQGGVLVSRGGSAYQAVAQPTQLRVGDSVIVNPGGGARVVFDNGCVAELEPGMVYTVPETLSCQASDTTSTGSIDYTIVAAGTALVVGGVAIAIAAGGGGGGGSSP